VKVLGTPLLAQFKQRHPDAASQVDAWLAEAKEAGWQNPHEVRKRYASVSFLKDGKTVFNIKGGNYRIGVRINYENQIMVIEKTGTHQEYNDWKW